MTRKERIDELDIFRSFAIIAVVCIHSTSATLSATQGTSLYYPFLFINIFSKFAVPVFIFLSGFVLFYNYMDRPMGMSMLGKFFTKRLLYILVPYILFSAIYTAVQLYLGGPSDASMMDIMQGFGSDLLTGDAYTHLYYVIIMLQLYILFPLLLWWFQKQRSIWPWVALIGLALQWAFVYVHKYGFHLPKPDVSPRGIHLPLPKGSVVLSYMAYFLFGGFIGIYYSRVKEWILVTRQGFRSGKGVFWIALWLLWLIIGALHVGVYYRLNVLGIAINSFGYELLWNVHSMLSCIVLMQLSHGIYHHGGKLLRSALTSMGACSFGIFLLHPMVLLFYRRIPAHGGTFAYAAWIAGGWAAALVLSWIVVYVAFRCFKGSWVLFGSVPKFPLVNKVHQGTGK